MNGEKNWAELDSSCVICEHPLGTHDQLVDGELPGRIIKSVSGSGEPVVALMCSLDAYAYSRQSARGAFNLERIVKCRLSQLETRRQWQQEPDQHPSVRVRCHVASFEGVPEPMLFVKVTNETVASLVQITGIYLEGDSNFQYSNEDERPLPVHLRPREIFETWISLEEMHQLDALESTVRVQVGGGETVPGEVNHCVPPFGVVGGPGRVADNVYVHTRDASAARTRTWDVFVSYAGEDLVDVARPLKLELEALGIRTWIAETEIKIGDSLRQRIDEGIRSSRFAAAVISPDYLRKGWTNWELDGVVTSVVGGRQNLLPILHNLSRDDLARRAPTLAGKFARSTEEESVRDIAREIASVVRPEPRDGNRFHTD